MIMYFYVKKSPYKRVKTQVLGGHFTNFRIR